MSPCGRRSNEVRPEAGTDDASERWAGIFKAEVDSCIAPLELTGVPLLWSSVRT